MAQSLSCPLLSVRPLRCMVDERFDVRVQGLLPGFRVTLHAQLQSEDADFWEGFGHYVSDDSGTVTGAYKSFYISQRLVYTLLDRVCSR